MLVALRFIVHGIRCVLARGQICVLRLPRPIEDDRVGVHGHTAGEGLRIDQRGLLNSHKPTEILKVLKEPEDPIRLPTHFMWTGMQIRSSETRS